MSETKHTPGPWTACRGVKQSDFQEHDTVLDADGWDVAHVEERKNDGEQHANTRLITAAPDLLAACEAAVTMFKVRPDSKLPEDIKTHYMEVFRQDPVCRQLLAAIAKAQPD